MTTTTSTSRRSSSNPARAITIALGGTRAVHIRCSTRTDGDFHRTSVPFEVLDARRRAFVGLPWTQLDERHGIDVVTVRAPGDGDGVPGDVALTDLDDVVLGCWVGDCAPVVLVGAERQVAVVHAGWLGLAAGVVKAAGSAFGEPVVRAVLGPVIGPCCYEFGATDAAAVAVGVGADVEQIVGRTTGGGFALDVPAAVCAAVETAFGDVPIDLIGGCTGCDYPGYSYRVRRDPERHVLAVWQTGGAPTAGRVVTP